MATAVSTIAPDGQPSEWARKYPPLFALAVAIIIAAIVLPSSLNVPQSNPSTTLEFAPVPPDKDKPPPPVGGNLGNLGLGSSSGLTTGGLPGGDDGGPGEQPPPTGAPAGAGKSPRTKRCTGNPPKQTEDPLAPPCVADFQGDNFGETYLGVTREEVRILIYFQGSLNYVNTCRDPNQSTPDGKYFDLAQDPQPNEHCAVRAMRVWQTYFNDRFQTYGRFAHFFVYFSGSGGSSEERKADAADNFATVKPFAVVHDSASTNFIDDYLNEMNKRGVLVFDGQFGRDAAFFNKFPGRTWGYLPTQQLIAKMFGGLICTKVAGQPVAQTGNPTDVGKPRKYGLIYTSDPAYDNLRKYKDLVVEYIKGCGVEISKTAVFPSCCYVADSSHSARYAQTSMAEFQQAGITTIIWAGGLETNYSKSGAAIGYRPELILGGDKLLEADVSGTTQDQSFWDNAFIMTNLTAVADIRTSPCYLAYREADPGSDDTDARISGCQNYDSIRQLFTGIQVAGPRLNPQSIDNGFHAIPRQPSTGPATPACFYEAGDYTCVKDGMLEKWDRTADNNQGCYRMVEAGKRYFAEIWPEGNINAQYKGTNASDPCNTYTSSFIVNNRPPKPGDI